MTTIETDVAVIAAGPAGLAAAIAAAESGARVTVFEKSATCGGAANMGMGPFAVESVLQKHMMVSLTKEEAFQIYMTAMNWNVDAKIVHDYFWRSADTIEWLMGMGVEFAGVMKNFPTSQQTWHVVRPEGGGPTGTRCASVMNKLMHEHALGLGVEFHLSTPATSLVTDGGAVTGLRARGESGDEYEVSAGAVVIATGGFATSPEMVADLTGYTSGKDMFTFMIPGLVGDGIQMAWKAGAGRGRIMMEKFLGHAMPGVATGQVTQFLNFLQGSPIAVNKAGTRICDESVMQNMSIAANIVDQQQDRTVYKILDDTMIRYFRKNGQEFPNEVFQGDPTENFEEAWEAAARRSPDCAAVADTIAGLAERIGVPVAALEESVDRYNAMCAQNYDEDFNKPRRYLRPLNGRTFYAYRVTIAAYGSLGGIKINSGYQALTETGDVVPGLYAAGADACEIYDGTYFYDFPGNSMGFALNSGRIAGERAAAQVRGA